MHSISYVKVLILLVVLKSAILFINTSALGQSSNNCQELLAAGRGFLYDTREYKKAKKALLASRNCFEESNKREPGNNALFLARVYYFLYEDSLSAFNYQKAIKSFNQENDSLSLSKVLNSYGNLISGAGFYDSAIFYFDQSIIYCEQSDNTLGIAVALNNKGNALKNLGKYENALQALYRSLAIYEAEKASDHRISKSMLNIGALLDELGKPKKALSFYNKSISLKKNINDSSGIARVYNNIGIIHKNDHQLDSAVYYYNLSSSYAKNVKLKDIKWDNLINISNIYAIQQSYDKVENSVQDALSLAISMSDEGRIGESYYQLGNLKFNQQDTTIGLYYLTKSLPVVKKTKSFSDLKDIYEKLAQGNYSEHNYKTAYDLRLLRDQNKDSVYQRAKVAAMEDVIERYESEKKDQQIAYLDQENDLKEASLERNVFLIIGLVVFIILLVLIFYLFRYRTKQNHLQQIQLQKIKMREAQMQAVIDSQERERKRFATDLHDGMGQLVSALQLNVQAMNEVNSDADKRDKLYENSTLILKDVHTEIRNIAFNLMPQTLVKEGLVPAVNELINRINKTEKMSVDLSVTDVENRFDEVVEVSLYRIIQEFLSNILKYSKAKNIYLGLTNHEDEFILSIEDNGVGYEIEEFKVSEGNGWRNIHTRLNLINGSMEIDTKKGRTGSTVMISIPSFVNQLDSIDKPRTSEQASRH